MKILVYMGHPAHFHLLKNPVRELEKKGHRVIVLIQKKDILEDLLRGSGFTYRNILAGGRKDTKLGLAIGMIKRDTRLLRLCLKEKPKPDIMIGTSIELPHIGKLLRIPTINLNEDDCQAVPLYCKLSYPLSSVILVPKSCDTGKWEKKTIHYDGYHELAYLHPHVFQPQKEVVEKQLSPEGAYFILRFAKLTAHHDAGKTGITTEIAREIIKRLTPHGRVFITSQRVLEPEFEPYRIPLNPVDMHHALYYAGMYLGDSQTMTAEAAVLGTPALRFNDFVGKLGYLEELEHKYGLTYGIKTSQPERLFEKIDELLKIKDRKQVWQQRRQKMLEDKIDVTAFLVWFIENYPKSAEEIKSFCGGSRGAVFSKRAPLAAGGKKTNMNNKKIILVAGARPNFMKIAPLLHEMKNHPGIEPVLVHTGQHYDENMSERFFRELEILEPGINLGVGSDSHAVQTARIMEEFEKVCLEEKPDAVLVVGDVNSTAACTLVASKLRIITIHYEAGLRSRDKSMPEEINRLVTDAISDLFFTTSKDASENLIKEGHPKENIFMKGNLMIDTLVRNLEKAESIDMIFETKAASHEKIRLGEDFIPGQYGVLTFHRPTNVDQKEDLEKLGDIWTEVSEKIPLVFPVHPRTWKNILAFGLDKRMRSYPRLFLIEPVGYLHFIRLMRYAKFVLTDSGGIQEETTYLHIPCLTIRPSTERPVTVWEGSNKLIKVDDIMAELDLILQGKGKTGKVPRFWDGRSAGRIVEVLLEELVDI